MLLERCVYRIVVRVKVEDFLGGGRRGGARGGILRGVVVFVSRLLALFPGGVAFFEEEGRCAEGGGLGLSVEREEVPGGLLKISKNCCKYMEICTHLRLDITVAAIELLAGGSCAAATLLTSWWREEEAGLASIAVWISCLAFSFLGSGTGIDCVERVNWSFI